MKILRWIRDFWYIPFLILALLLGWILFRGRRGTPLTQTKAELEAIEAGRLAREIQEREGLAAAKQHLAAEHADELNALDEKQRAKAKELRDDPGALAKFLVRAGRRN